MAAQRHSDALEHRNVAFIRASPDTILDQNQEALRKRRIESGRSRPAGVGTCFALPARRSRLSQPPFGQADSEPGTVRQRLFQRARNGDLSSEEVEDARTSLHIGCCCGSRSPRRSHKSATTRQHAHYPQASRAQQKRSLSAYALAIRSELKF